MGIENIIFDMDGTLVDSEFCSAQAMIDVLPEFSLNANDLLDKYRGTRLDWIIRDLSSEFGVPIDAGRAELFRQRERALAPTLISLNAGVAEFLASNTVRCCIASNAPREKTHRSLQICKIADHFGERVYSAYDVDAWKPDPALFLHVAREEGFGVDQCLVVEDSAVGIDAAIAAGMSVVCFSSVKREVPAGVVGVIYDMRDLFDIIRSLD
ncbi:MAG: HAD-IA family hydrolase [Pseudomonadota bacterium]